MAKSLRRWHRWTGLVISVVAAVVAVTGILLNHTEDLSLDERSLGNPALLALYGLDGEPEAEWVAAGGHELVHVDGLLYFDAEPIVDLAAPLIGATATDAGIVAASAERLLLIDDDGHLVEALGETFGLPVPIEALGVTADGKPAFRAKGRIYAIEPDTLNWVAVTNPLDKQDGARKGIPDGFSHALPKATVSLEHLILDLHTGRVLGRLGPWLADLVAVGLCFLAASGIVMALRRRRVDKR